MAGAGDSRLKKGCAVKPKGASSPFFLFHPIPSATLPHVATSQTILTSSFGVFPFQVLLASFPSIRICLISLEFLSEEYGGRYMWLVVSRIFRTFSLAERHPALAHAVMAPLICWSLSSSMLRYLFVDHAVPAMWRSLAAARLSAD
jgi:hypothetical protein